MICLNYSEEIEEAVKIQLEEEFGIENTTVGIEFYDSLEVEEAFEIDRVCSYLETKGFEVIENDNPEVWNLRKGDDEYSFGNNKEVFEFAKQEGMK